jgi:hypothetical protein
VLSLTVTRSEYDTSILDCLLHVKAVSKAGDHRLLGKYMASLGSECIYHFVMHIACTATMTASTKHFPMV